MEKSRHSENYGLYLLTIQYGTAMGGGVILGMLLAVPTAGLLSRLTVTTTGVLIPVYFPVLPCVWVFAILLLVPMSFCILRLWSIKNYPWGSGYCICVRD